MAGAVEFRENIGWRSGSNLFLWFGGEPRDGLGAPTCCRCAITYGELRWDGYGIDNDCCWHADGDIYGEAGLSSYALSRKLGVKTHLWQLTGKRALWVASSGFTRFYYH